MAETKRRFEELTGGVIVEGYSLTEAQMAVVANPVRGEKKVGSVGMPLPDVDLRILDAENGSARMPLGEVGEIVIAAPQIMLGYWQRPEETKEMLRTDDAWRAAAVHRRPRVPRRRWLSVHRRPQEGPHQDEWVPGMAARDRGGDLGAPAVWRRSASSGCLTT